MNHRIPTVYKTTPSVAVIVIGNSVAWATLGVVLSFAFRNSRWVLYTALLFMIELVSLECYFKAPHI